MAIARVSCTRSRPPTHPCSVTRAQKSKDSETQAEDVFVMGIPQSLPPFPWPEEAATDRRLTHQHYGQREERRHFLLHQDETGCEVHACSTGAKAVFWLFPRKSLQA